MVGILYKDDGEVIEVLTQDNNYGYYLPDGFGFDTQKDFCIIIVTNSFGFNFQKINESEKLEDKINQYIEVNGNFTKILFILNEIIVEDESDFERFGNKIGKEVYFANFDMMNIKNRYQKFLPLSLYTQIDFLLNKDYLNARNFLENMNREYHNLIKPYKYSFYSNHVSPTRIDIFNILKSTDNLKNGMWSFNDSLVYYSGEKHNLSSFFKDNEGLIPYSFDRYSEKTINLKHTYLPHFLCYFEIIAESYFFRTIEKMGNHCPITEKIVKSVVSCLPFIVFGPSNLKSTLESIGMRFTSPLYGFYDITDDNSCRQGYGHVVQQVIEKIDVIHDKYFQFIQEYENNSRIFIQYFIDNRKNLSNFLNSGNENQKNKPCQNLI